MNRIYLLTLLLSGMIYANFASLAGIAQDSAESNFAEQDGDISTHEVIIHIGANEERGGMWLEELEVGDTVAITMCFTCSNESGHCNQHALITDSAEIVAVDVTGDRDYYVVKVNCTKEDEHRIRIGEQQGGTATILSDDAEFSDQQIDWDTMDRDLLPLLDPHVIRFRQAVMNGEDPFADFLTQMAASYSHNGYGIGATYPGEYFLDEDSFPEHFRWQQEEYELQQSYQEQVWKLNSVESENEKETAAAELRKTLEKLFDRKLEKREKEIAELRKRLEDLEARKDERKAKRDEIIDLKLQSLINEANGLGF